MRSPFLIARSVILALLTYFSLLILVFASWNVHATSETKQSIPSSAILLIFNSCLLFVLTALSFAQFAFPCIKMAVVAFEIGWMLFLAMLEIGSSISLVVNGPVLTCQLSRDWDICASSYLLIPTVWLKSFLLLGYLFLLLITTYTHSRYLPSIWCTSVYTVPWFSSDNVSTAPGEPGVKALFDLENDTWTRYLADIAGSSERKRQHSVDTLEKAPNTQNPVEKAPWAQGAGIRRGVDEPFMRRDDDSSTNTSRTRVPLPERPARMEPTKALSVGSRFIERFRESRILSRPGQSHFSCDSTTSAATSFPQDVEDHDQPIPLPRLSQWMRADATKGSSTTRI